MRLHSALCLHIACYRVKILKEKKKKPPNCVKTNFLIGENHSWETSHQLFFSYLETCQVSCISSELRTSVINSHQEGNVFEL